MKSKNQVLVAVLLIGCMILTACGQEINNIKHSQEIISANSIKDYVVTRYTKMDYERYTEYINEIDESLEKYSDVIYEDVRYGVFSSYPYYSNLTTTSPKNGSQTDMLSDYFPYGEIISYFKDNNLMGFRMELGWNTDESYQKGGDYKYQCEKFLIGEDMEYYSYASDSNNEDEIPVFMCIDGITQICFNSESQEYTDKYVLRKSYCEREYISIDGSLYEIDREEMAIYKEENGIAKVYTNWCECQQRDILAAQKSFGITQDMVENEIPKGYKFCYLDDNYSVADIDLDGVDDILIEIYPILDQYDYNGDFSEDSPYMKIEEYGYYQLWVLKGMGDGKYKPQKIMDSIVWNEVYSLCQIKAYDGGFQMEYFVGRSPFETVLRKFQYDKEKQDWYLATQYKNSGYITGMNQGFTIKGAEEYGKVYLSGDSENEYYMVSVKEYVDDHCADLSEWGYDDYGCLVYFANEETADKVTKIIEQELDKIFSAMEKLDECQGVLLQNQPEIFRNANTLVICFKYIDKTKGGTFVGRLLPISIDLTTGTLINFREYFSHDEFVKLCEESYIEINQLDELYEHYGDYEYLLKAASPSITLLLSQEGLVIMETTEHWPVDYTITRDKFVDTPLANYWDDWP